MGTHYNIQVSVQKVTEAKPVTGRPGHPEPAQERQVLSIADIKVQAGTEAEAYDRVARILEATRPVPELHLHRASCDDNRGNRICGFPDGPTIASHGA